jgi:3-(methylthio)propanoyl-CoA dehydrogenase
MAYTAPINDISHALRHAAGLDRLVGQGGLAEFDDELVAAILEEAGKLCSEVLAPLNMTGDKEGATLTSDGVVAASGFREAYAQFRDGGWMGLGFPEEWGGQGLPKAIALAVMEMVHGANMAFGLAPMLSFGAIEALLAHGSEEQKRLYLPKLIGAEWTGTMNLTEPQAGSDVGALKTKAVPQADGSYQITGQKIYITWGDHDLTDNIIHLVLARLPDAPEGSRGVSLFLVPKVMVNADGALGERNRVNCIGLESKVGIHASPTCVMEYDGATGWLIGEANKGLAHMFTMMNSARLNVGLEGVGVGEAAAQAAIAFAKERKQGKVQGIDGAAPIIHHSDVRRMLTEMQARVAAARAICYACGVNADLAEAGDEQAGWREEVLVPIAKAWSTDMGVEVASTGVQVHGGMGFMDETLAAQLYRDARIAPIYEGTNGIQAIDLVGRKLALADGAAMQLLIDEVAETARAARSTNETQMVHLAQRLEAAHAALVDATAWMRETMASDRDTALSGATAYLKLAGDVIGGHFLVRGVLGTRSPELPITQRNRAMALAGFFAETALASAPGMVAAITGAGRGLKENVEALFGSI